MIITALIALPLLVAILLTAKLLAKKMLALSETGTPLSGEPLSGWEQSEAGWSYRSPTLLIGLVRSSETLLFHFVLVDHFESAVRVVYVYPIHKNERPLALPVRAIADENFICELDQANPELRRILKKHEDGMALIVNIGSKNVLISPRGFNASSFVSNR